jgi:hypothetical protein
MSRFATIKRYPLAIASLLILLGVALLSHSAAAATLTFQTIDNPSDPTFNQLLGINNSGIISGYFGSGAPNGTPAPFTLTPNQGYTVPVSSPNSFTNQNFPGSSQTQVTGINSAGNTVGFWADSNGASAPNFIGYVDVGGTFTSVIDPSTPGTSPTTNQLLGLNDTGQAVGFYLEATGNSHGFVYNILGASFTAVVLPGGDNAVMTAATGINNAGAISGFYVDKGGNEFGFIDQGGSFTTFQANGDPTQFLGIDNSGLAVGFYTDATGMNHGILYTIAAGTFIQIDDPLAATGDGNGTIVNGLNDRNQLVGFYVDGNTNTNGVLVTIAPEPGTLVLSLLGFVVILRRPTASSQTHLRTP